MNKSFLDNLYCLLTRDVAI